MISRLSLVLLGGLCCLSTGCDVRSTSPAAGPFGATQATPLLSPFAGKWKFDFDRTLAAMSAAGTLPATIEQIRAFHQQHPELGPPHGDLSLTGNVAVVSNSVRQVEGEYRFFALHQHPENVCGKAWHHEDRHDPGDMSKCYVKLQLVEEKVLKLTVWMPEESTDVNDPDLINQPLEAGSVENCHWPTDEETGESMVYVFVR
jgi:hypothetical protein